MKKDNSWVFDDETYEQVKREISEWPEWKREYYNEAYVGVGKSYIPRPAVTCKMATIKSSIVLD